MRQKKNATKWKAIAIAVGFRFAVALTACAPSDRAADIEELSGNLENGRILYSDHCADCHGANGDDGHSVNLLRRRIVELTPAEHADIIIERMEEMGRRSNRISLSNQEIADLIAAVRALQGLNPDWLDER